MALFFPEIKARDTIERLAAAADPYAVTRADLVAAVRLIGREELVQRFAHDPLLANFVLNHWEFAHGSATLTTYPWNVAIPISDVCNARCGFCNSWLRGKRLLDMADLERFAPVLRHATMISLEGHGEPLVHPKFRDIAAHLRQLVDQRCRMSIITNGLLLNERMDELLALGVNVFNVSLNAASAKVHERVMGLGADGFDRVVSNLRALSRHGADMESSRKPALNLSLVVTAFNVHEIPQFIELAQELDASQVNLRTLLPQTELLAGLNYHELPAYLAPDFPRCVAEAQAAINAARVTVEADVASWSRPIFPPEVQARIDRDKPESVDRRQASRLVYMQKDDYKGLERIRSRGEPLAPGTGDPRWTVHEPALPDIPSRPAGFKCGDVYTTLHMNDFFFVLRPCCYMDAVPNHAVIKYDSDCEFFEVWNSPAMVSLRQRLREGPLYGMCRRCPQQPQYPAPEPRDDDYETVPSGLGQWESGQWPGGLLTDRGAEGVAIATPAKQWAYAAWRPVLEVAPGIGGRLVVDISVQEGEVGAGLLKAGGQEFLAEAARDAASPRALLRFDVPDLSAVAGLVLRNHGSRGVARATVHSVEMQQRRGAARLENYVRAPGILSLFSFEPTEFVASANWIESDDDFVRVGAGSWEREPGWDSELTHAGTDRLSIATPPQQWAYAARAILCLPEDAEGRIAVKLKVVEGVVGLVLLDAQGAAISTEAVLDTNWDGGRILFHHAHLSDVHSLVLRNTRPSGERSRVEIQEVLLEKKKVRASGQHSSVAEQGLHLVAKAIPWASLAFAKFRAVSTARGPAAIKMRLRVLQGQVLVGILDQTNANFITHAFWGATRGLTELILYCPAIELASAIVIRCSNLVEPLPALIVDEIDVVLPGPAAYQK